MKTNSREIWAKRVTRWRDSGLTAKQFAAEIGVNAWTLAHWKWRLGAEQRGKQPRGKRRSSKSAPRFVEVPPAAVAQVLEQATADAGMDLAKNEPLEVVLRNGCCIRVPVHFAAAALEQVVAVLERR